MKKLATFSLILIALFLVITLQDILAEETPSVPLQIEDRLTLELQSVSIFDVFKILSKKSGLNIVAGKNVQGQVSIFLQDVPVMEALKTILESQGLASITEGGIIKVMTEEEFLKKYGQPYSDTRITKSFQIKHTTVDALSSKLSELKSAYGKVMIEARTNTLIITEIPSILEKMENIILESDHPQESAVFKLNYTKAEDLKEKLAAYLEGGTGKIEIDKRSNRILVLDIPERIERIRTFVEAFDVITPQVLIEAKIVEVRLSDAYRKGINWQEVVDQVGHYNELEALAPLTVGTPTGASSLATLSLGEGEDDLQIMFQFLEHVGKTNILSSPRITVLNDEEAKLAVATREPFVSQTVVQTTNSTNTADNVQFVDVGVTLKVQPRISQNQFVEMKIKPEVSSSSRSLELEGVSQGSDTTFTRTRIPIVTSQELETTVQIKSGHTLIIGGLIQDQQGKSSSQVPILSAMPLFGRLFQSNTDDFSKTELVIFLTPRIVHPSDQHQSSKRFLTSRGTIKPFEDFGGYSIRLPSGILASEKMPYWEKGKENGRQ